VDATNFQYVQSLILILMAYVGGINTVSGALVGGLLLGAAFPILSPHLPHRFQELAFVGTGLGAITVGRFPGGIMEQISRNVERFRSTAVPTAPPRATVAREGANEGGTIAAPVG
jgi:ABC-type branched-subunit amino acid transport system permease subunit